MGIASPDLAMALQWVIAHGYWLMFLAMLVEGPIVTAAASFAVALGYFNIGYVLILSLLGDVVADVIYYSIGYWGRMTLVAKYGRYVGLSKERLTRIERLLEANSIKTLVALKLTPFIPTPGLMLVGVARMKLSKFTLTCLLITIPKTILFMLAGYYFGEAYGTFSRDFGYVSVGIVVIILIYAFYKLWLKSAATIGSKIEKL